MAADYEVEITSFAAKEFAAFERSAQKKLAKALERMPASPFVDAIKMKHQSDNLWRKKVSRDFRIIFAVFPPRKIRVLAFRLRTNKTYDDLDSLAKKGLDP